ncbi:MAG: substrate-binding domain-containing protein [Peptococcaceae bacterium]|nr:substrate-binding domain-containing protein [Peptococcaceae bacterium]
MVKKIVVPLLAVLLLVLSLTACAPRQPLILATTTSTVDSGLLEVLVPLFEKETGITVQTVSVGTGKALAMGERGEADVLLVHSPEAEQKLVASGAVINRQYVMYNDFVIVGPKADPAGVRGGGDAGAALRSIAEKQSPFVSRGDDSGTHKKELALWAQVAVAPAGQWYIESGTGMGQTLSIADERQAYVLTDRGTFLAHRANLTLEILVVGDPALMNPYHVMQVNPERFPKVNARGAARFVNFMLSTQAQKVIKEFGVEKHGEPLFFPAVTGR